MHESEYGRNLLNWQALRCEDSPRLRSFFSSVRLDISELTLANLFIRLPSRHTEWALFEEALCIRVLSDTGWMHYFPIVAGNNERTIAHVCEILFDADRFVFRSLLAEQAELIERAHPGTMHFDVDRDRWDYVYRVSDLVELKGDMYHGKKNHINRFVKKYGCYTYRTMTAADKDAVRIALDEWCIERDCDEQEDLRVEKEGIISALSDCDQLELKGGLLECDGKVVAFSLGASLNEDTVVIHIEKADTKYNGSYQMINQQFLQHEWLGKTWVNREDDSGVEGLRKAKESYHPVRMIEKYLGTMANETSLAGKTSECGCSKKG